MRYRHILLPAVGLLLVIGAVLVWADLVGNVVYYLTPSEAIAERETRPSGYRFRLGGLVEETAAAEGVDEVRFMVGDGAVSIPVIHKGVVPELFKSGIGVVVEGAWDGDRFRSDTLLINHDEQYRAAEGEGTYQVPSAGP